MFSHKYFLHEPGYAALLESAKQYSDPLLRYSALMLFAHDLFGWFDKYPSLTQAQLTAVALVEVEKVPLAIRVRHHFKLRLTGSAEASATLQDADGYILARLPWETMGHGAFEILREDALVQAYLKLSTDQVEDYQGLVYRLAQRLDIVFQDISIVHDVGLSSVMTK